MIYSDIRRKTNELKKGTICQTSSSAITERSRCRVGSLWPKVEDWNWETIFTDIIGPITVTYLASKAIEFGEKRKIRAIIVQSRSRSSMSVPIESPYATYY